MHRVELDKFQGPLDLLLYFIRRDEIDIYDIPIAEITAEYLQIVEDVKAMNISIAGEFILMAATLMRIKSKMLLPRPDLDDLGEPIDPRTELVQQLLEYKKYKDIADNLSEKWEKLSYQHERMISEPVSEKEDLNILKEVFNINEGKYNVSNSYWKSYSILKEIDKIRGKDKLKILKKVDFITKNYDEFSQIYQNFKDNNKIPLK